ncbi:hypothetical protein RND71_021890 [Anisodus tanguticus]|uniref:Uncharacterized protein n=1 Tax=Anisodus tanguticus TaxID=243964 RepID=A0AAE1RZB3_9SOLA|nr:hypothetical protein RND71_021890 [Anisodus tanguticus]
MYFVQKKETPTSGSPCYNKINPAATNCMLEVLKFVFFKKYYNNFLAFCKI